MFNPPPDLRIPVDSSQKPRLLVIIDTEEEFSWDSFSPNATGVDNIAHQHRAQVIFSRFGIVPTYLVDYPVASQPNGIAPLKEMLQSKACLIGSQLHGWVNPPIEEAINHHNTFQCNLPPALERAKIARLTQAITDNFDIRPTVFKAGRNGIGPNTVAALIEHGYTIDNSVLPYADLSPEGPDFIGAPGQPFWLEAQRRLLEIPMTVGLVGLLNGITIKASHALLSKISTRFKIPGILARSGLLERIRLTPEGISIDEAIRLTQGLMQRGQRLFVMCYHSSSLLPGSTPYVRNGEDLGRFLSWLTEYLEFFFNDLGGQATTPDMILAEAQKER